jgi:methylaspartate ammonia-lyase
VGTEPALGRQEALETVRRVVASALEGRPLAGFRVLAAEVDALSETAAVTRSRPATGQEDSTPDASGAKEGISRRTLLTAPARLLQAASAEQGAPTEQVTIERRLHPALRYGLSQALLRAVGLVRGRMPADVVADEWGLGWPQAPVGTGARSAYDQRHQAESMIQHRVASLPHAPIDALGAQVGSDGGRLTLYLHWLRARIAALESEEYCPAIHLDLAGALGEIANHHPGYMLGHLHAWRMATGPYPLRIEDPILLPDRQAQFEALRTLRDNLRLRRIDVQLVARRWINTLDDLGAFLAAQGPGLPADMIHLQMPQLGSLHNAVEGVLACKRGGIGVLLGGAASETDLATRTGVHVALTTQPDLFLARSGADAGSAVSLARNEMARALATVTARPPSEGRLAALET